MILKLIISLIFNFILITTASPVPISPDVSTLPTPTNSSLTLSSTAHTPLITLYATPVPEETTSDDSVSVEGIKDLTLWKSLESKFKKEGLYDIVSDDTGLPAQEVKKYLNSLFYAYSKNATKPIDCAAVKGNTNFKGLCQLTDSRTLYVNDDRAPVHRYRSYLMPFTGIGSVVVVHGIRHYVCKYEIVDPVKDFGICLYWGYHLFFVEVATVGVAIMGYQDLTKKPFFPVCVRILNLFRQLNMPFTGYSAVSETGEVIPLTNAVPNDFQLKYIFTSFGVPGGRNTSLAIFPGSKDSEVGVSFITKPWEPAPVLLGPEDDFFVRQKYHWQYVMKIDLDEINYHMDQVSPEEFYHNIGPKMFDFSSFLYFDNGLLSNSADVYIDLDDDIDKEEQSYFRKTPGSVQGEFERFYANFHGIKIRMTISQHAEHTVDW